MSGRLARVRPALPWVGFGLAVALATFPTWGFLLLGFDPTLDDLLQLRCFGASTPG